MEFVNDIEKLSTFLVKLKQMGSSPVTEDPAEESEEQHNLETSVIVSENEKGMHYLKKCLRENKKCHSLLNQIEYSVNLLLENCVREQKIVNENIEVSSSRRELFMRRKLSAPYFKDANGFSHSHNDDVFKREAQGFVSQCNIIVPRPWNEHEKHVVVEYIKQVEKEKWVKTLESCHMLHMANVEKMSLEELVESRYDEYDWLKISVSSLDNAHSPEECQALWFTCLHPQINQQLWTEEENEKLKSLVMQYKCQDWDKIARKLGTKRSAFQCISHFKRQVSKQSKRQWTENEIILLKKCVKIFRFKEFIPWYNVKMFMDGCSVTEIYRLWNKINSEGKPRTFSLEEDIVLVAGIKLFGNDYSCIQEYLPERTARQVRRRVEVLKFRQFPKQVWSAQEDTLLRSLVEKYGFGNWLKISMHFVNRSQDAVRTRYLTLQKYKSNETCASTAFKNPMRRTDMVNLTLLWESAVKICQENKICNNMCIEDNSSFNLMHELSQILKPKMRLDRVVADNELKPLLDREYYKFFQGAYLQNVSKEKRPYKSRKFIHTLGYDIVMVLKLLEAKIILPIVEDVENDKVISFHEKCIIKYLVNEIVSKSKMYCETFVSHADHNHDVISEENPVINSNNISHLLPPNYPTLIAMHSLLLKNQNLKEQKEGLTMQMDDIELKEMNTLCSPRKLHYGENYIIAGKLWNERIDKLLIGTALVLNKGCKVLHT